jgi:hypothetical protein
LASGYIFKLSIWISCFRVLFGCNSTFEHPAFLNSGNNDVEAYIYWVLGAIIVIIRFLLHNFQLKLLSIALYYFMSTLYMYSNWNYQNIAGKNCRIEKNPIMISPYSIFEVYCGVRLYGQNACYVIFWNIAPKHWIYMDTRYCNSFYFYLWLYNYWCFL